jgi:hypothetical protein
MSSYETQWQQDARLAILAELADQRDETLNALNLARVVEALGIRRPSEWIETQLRFLESMGAVELRSSPIPGLGTVIVATLLGSGRDHVERRTPLAGVSWPAGKA